MKYAKIYILRTFLIQLKSNETLFNGNLLGFLSNMVFELQISEIDKKFISDSLLSIFDCDCILDDSFTIEEIERLITEKIVEFEKLDNPIR